VITAAEHRIRALLGRDPAALAARLGEAAAPALPELGPVPDLASVVRARPDVVSAERRLAGRSSFVAAARADFLPRVSIAGMAGYTAGRFESLGEAGTPRYAVGPVVTWPLLDLGRVRAGVDAARAAEAEAAEQYRAAVLRGVEEAQSSLVGYRKARERLEHLEAAAAASERATELARLRFEEGATGFLEVLDAERTQLEAQDRLAAGRAEAAIGMVAVYHALGGRWPAEHGRP
jgi:outer membrane protein, multidrug efflux system